MQPEGSFKDSVHPTNDSAFVFDGVEIPQYVTIKAVI